MRPFSASFPRISLKRFNSIQFFNRRLSRSNETIWKKELRREGKIKEDLENKRERRIGILDLLDRDITFNWVRGGRIIVIVIEYSTRIEGKFGKGRKSVDQVPFFFLFRGDTVGPAPLGGSWHPEVSSARILTDLSSQYELPSPQPGCFCPRELSRRFSSRRSSSASVSGLHRLITRNSWNWKSGYLRNEIDCASKFMVKFSVQSCDIYVIF